MSLLGRVRAFLVDHGPGEPLPPRHERREAARERHHLTGQPAWSADDRHLGPDGPREVQDITPGFAGEQASHRVIGE